MRSIVKARADDARKSSVKEAFTELLRARAAIEAHDEMVVAVTPFRESMNPSLEPLPHVLLVEDEPAILDGLESLFAVSGFVVARAADGGLADARLARERFDLIVLDLMLPTMTGLEVLKRLRERGDDTPVLVLTAKGTEEDVVLGLELGADDYVTKPFAIRELVARSRGLLRRPRAAGAAKRITIGAATLDLDRHELSSGSITLRLTMRETMFLAYLAERAPAAASREELLVDVWGYRDGTIRTRTIDVHVQQLRSKLRAIPAASEWIATVRGRGYRLER